jgi:hypothetical protein
VNAASAALFLYIKGHGASLYRDGLRLVLIIFLASVALWAQIDFITVLLDVQDSAMPCQIGVIFATVFDQLGRFAIEQYLLWAMNDGSKLSAGQLIPQLLIWGRLVVGFIFVGLTRTQTDTFCVATAGSMPLSIALIALDVVVLLVLVARAFQTGLTASIAQNKADSSRNKAVIFVMLGFGIWTAVRICCSLRP